jgi:hypothetical protein
MGVGSCPQVDVIMLLAELVATIPSSGVMAFVVLDGPKSHGCRHGPYHVVGGVVHLSCQAVFGWWISILAVIARRCCLVYATWRRDGI